MLILLLLAPASAAPRCVAHRGNVDGPSAATENSLAAFRQALAVGVDGVELDVQYTEDGVPLVLHDARLRRTAVGEACPLRTDVQKLLFEQVRSSCSLRNGEPIPTLPEAMEVLAGAPSDAGRLVFVEFKRTAPSAETAQVLRDWSDANRERLWVISFAREALDAAEAVDPSFQTLNVRVFGMRANAAFDGVDRYYGFAPRRRTDGARMVGVWTVDGRALDRWLTRDVDFVTTNETRRCVALVSAMAAEAH